ncbi:MAG: hypothetical protein AMXMBFR61_02680 [Fimbriimonadales bacterium]
MTSGFEEPLHGLLGFRSDEILDSHARILTAYRPKPQQTNQASLSLQKGEGWVRVSPCSGPCPPTSSNGKPKDHARAWLAASFG